MLHQKAGSQYITGWASTGGLGVNLDKPINFYRNKSLTMNISTHSYCRYDQLDLRLQKYNLEVEFQLEELHYGAILNYWGTILLCPCMPLSVAFED